MYCPVLLAAAAASRAADLAAPIRVQRINHLRIALTVATAIPSIDRSTSIPASIAQLQLIDRAYVLVLLKRD
jgi:hypothetical protein